MWCISTFSSTYLPPLQLHPSSNLPEYFRLGVRLYRLLPWLHISRLFGQIADAHLPPPLAALLVNILYQYKCQINSIQFNSIQYKCQFNSISNCRPSPPSAACCSPGQYSYQLRDVYWSLISKSRTHGLNSLI